MKINNKIFETDSVDLAAYLTMNDLRYLGYTTDLDSLNERYKGVLRFEDPRGIAKDLERAFLNSDYKKYRDLNKYFLREVHKATKNKNFGETYDKQNRS